jgi:hypothetical protein
MSLTLVAAAVGGLTAQIRNRMAQGAAVWEVAAADMPSWLAAGVGAAAVEAAFLSERAGVAVLEGGRTVVRRAPQG